MHRLPEELIRFALAKHLDVEATSIRLNHRLEMDLGLSPLAVLVLIIHDLEGLQSGDLPIAQLMSARTVSDLADLLDSAWGRLLSEHDLDAHQLN